MASRREESKRARHSHRSNDGTDCRSLKPSSSSSRSDYERISRGRSSYCTSQSQTSSIQNRSFKRQMNPLPEHNLSKKSRREHEAHTHHISGHQKSSQKASKDTEELSTYNNNKYSNILPQVIISANPCPSGDLPLDLEALDKKSEQRLRQEKVVHLPDSNTYYFEKQKEQYYTSMYRLIVTARSHIQHLEQQVQLLNKRLDGKSIVTCPHCQRNFSTGPNRYLPKYLKVLRSTNRVELQFNDGEHLENWMVGADLDRDVKGIPCLINEQREAEKRTLKEVESSLLLTKTKKRASEKRETKNQSNKVHEDSL